MTSLVIALDLTNSRPSKSIHQVLKQPTKKKERDDNVLLFPARRSSFCRLFIIISSIGSPSRISCKRKDMDMNFKHYHSQLRPSIGICSEVLYWITNEQEKKSDSHVFQVLVHGHVVRPSGQRLGSYTGSLLQLRLSLQ